MFQIISGTSKTVSGTQNLERNVPNTAHTIVPTNSVLLGTLFQLAFSVDDIAYIDETQRPYRSQMSIRDLRERNIADKAARQCREDIGVYTDSKLVFDRNKLVLEERNLLLSNVVLRFSRSASSTTS